MKALVATRATQGLRATDRTDCVEGEMVWMVAPCDTSRRRPDGPCDCGRTFLGMSSQGRTTTAMVQNLPGLSRQDYEDALRGSFEARGLCSRCRTVFFAEHVDALLALAEALPEGSVVGRRLGRLVVRVRRQLPH
ncbi:hypothetical protein D6T64_08730 [Cryobacterium melibiosiphilum]|uniref:DUF7715 domain-containing protein n=1 Tax=Cryobacterium melibiosiphilum TaxID=995039 RepID=A0A3A5MFD1_9MICO|nr:hypothetical protein [Cryobacterium melibiosiphilum]RJT88860.1 hypothetical protein D6T64_08730 [Cryobacterium melibiosiphilum]